MNKMQESWAGREVSCDDLFLETWLTFLQKVNNPPLPGGKCLLLTRQAGSAFLPQRCV